MENLEIPEITIPVSGTDIGMSLAGLGEPKENIDNQGIIDQIIQGNWESVLLGLTEDMDPWDIDLIVLSRRFMDFIKKTNKMELDIPAKILLAAAILYRMKVDTLKYEDKDMHPESVFEEALPENAIPITGENLVMGDIIIPPLSVPVKRYPRRKISIDELISSLDKAMTIKNRREARQVFYVDLESEDISDTIENIFDAILGRIELNQTVTFSSCIDGSDRSGKIRTFSSILHLSNQERIYCMQKELFGEIYISLLTSSKALEGKQNA